LKGAKKAKFKEIQNSPIELSVGDVIVMYGSIMTYGLVADISETESTVVFLTTKSTAFQPKSVEIEN